MAKFTDATGDDWRVEITVFHTGRVRADVEVNLNDALVKDGGDGSPDRNLITRLDSDNGLLVAVLYCLCEEQIKNRNLTPDDFAKRFAGDILNAAFAALLEALLAFFRKPNERAALQAQMRMMEQGQRRLLERWKQAEPEVDKLAANAFEAQIDRELENLRVRFGQATSTGSSPAPPAT